MTPTQARGYRNHNPGNIRHAKGVYWQGADENQSRDRDFVQFTAPEWGIRAIARVLITYQDKRRAKDGSRIDTVREFIARWAPPSENNTDAYAVHVAQLMRIGADATIDVTDYRTMDGLVRAIITHELGGQPYSDAVIAEGLRLAGLKPADAPPVDRPVLATAEGQAGAAATAAGLVLLGQQLGEAGALLLPFKDDWPWLGAVAIACVIAAGIIAIWAKRRALKTATP